MAITITPRLIIEAAERRGWTCRIISEEQTFYRLDTPEGKYFYLRNITSKKSTAVDAIISTRKELLYELIAELNVPVPATISYVGDMDPASDFLATHGRVVVKPTDQSHGDGITTNITNPAELELALNYASEYSTSIQIQQHIDGDDHRLLFIGGTLAAAAVRVPASVTGDGKQSVLELITQENSSPKRGQGYQNVMTRIDMEAAQRYLGTGIKRIPDQDEVVQVVGVANIGKGGVSVDVTDTVDPAMVEAASKVVDHFGIGLCGVDFLRTSDGKFYLIEINAVPSLGLHEYPSVGEKQNTPDKFLDWLAQS